MIQHPTLPTGKNRYCFPFVLGAILGLTTDQIERKILQHRRKMAERIYGTMGKRSALRTDPDYRRVTGVEWREAFALMGRPAHEVPVPVNPISLRQFAEQEGANFGDALVILGTRPHVVLMHRGLLADNNNRQWKEPKDFKGGRGRMIQFYRVPDWKRKRASRPLTNDAPPATLGASSTGDPGHVR